VNAKLEEQKKSGDQVTLSFSLFIATKPNVVKYSITGTVTLEGKSEAVKKKLEVNPKTKIPQILFAVYQHVFNSIYMLASILNTPYPPPDLLHPMAEKIQIVSTSSQAQSEKGESPEQQAKEQPSPPAATPTPVAAPAAEAKAQATTEKAATKPS
jgi:hypothetical protein